jgi:uncharacterized membrane protein YeaQ/YmgE (transglycosylase-associated protein family)
MGFLAWIVLGGVAGWIASMIMHTDASQGIILNVVVGIVGAFIGGFAFNFFGGAGVTGFNLYSLLVSILGAVVLLYVTKIVRG